MLDEQAIFELARGLADPAARAKCLDEACAGDADLRRRIDALLAAHDEQASFLERPAVDPRLAPTAGLPVVAEQPGMMIGPYKLMEQIGEGGFGLVFVADQQHPVRRRVALKVIKPGMDTREVVARFEAERQALALMDHPNIARVFDAGTTGASPPLSKGGQGGSRGGGTAPDVGQAFQPDASALSTSDYHSRQAGKPDLRAGRPYFVMELVRGVPITQFCDQHQLTPRERLDLFVTVCKAVHHAHQKGVIHRDIKPSNVLVTMNDGKPLAKVIDFGIAKAIGQQLTERTIYTRFAQIVGTPLYMSPEQAQLSAHDVDTRSDIYSLGVLLYELLTGTTPFDRDRLSKAAFDEIRRIIREEEPPKPSLRLTPSSATFASVAALRRMEPSRLSRLVRGELDWIVMKALEKDRNRRYESAASFGQDVQRYLDDEPVEASPPSATYRLKKLWGRHAIALSIAAAFGIVLLAATAVSAWMSVRAREAAQVALEAKTEAEKARKDSDAARTEAERGRAAEAQARREVELNVVRVELERFMEVNANNGNGSRTARQERNIAALRLSKFLGGMDDYQLALREDVSLALLAYGQQIRPLLEAPRRDGFELPCKLSEDGHWLVADTDFSLDVYSFPRLEKRAALSMDGKRISSHSMHGPSMVWAISTDGLQVRVWSLGDRPVVVGTILPEKPVAYVWLNADGATCLTIRHEDPCLGQTSDGGCDWAETWETRTGRRLAEFRLADLPKDVGWHGRALLSPDGRWLATVFNRRLSVWSAADGNLRLRFDLPNQPPENPSSREREGEAVLFSPNGDYLVAISCKFATWWRTVDWNMVEPVCRLDSRSSEEFSFVAPEIISERPFTTDGNHRATSVWRGEARPRPYGVRAVIDGTLLTCDGSIQRSIPTASMPVVTNGKRLPPATLQFAMAGRYVRIANQLVDIVTDAPIMELNVHLIDSRSYRPTGDSLTLMLREGVAWVIEPAYSFGSGPLESKVYMLFPESPAALDRKLVELWLQVLVRGELDELDEFRLWSEAEWETHRLDLSRRAVRFGDFEFPGRVAHDRRFWLRDEIALSQTDDALAANPSRADQLTRQLVEVEPGWQSHYLRARFLREIDQYADSIREEFEAYRLGGASYVRDGPMGFYAAEKLSLQTNLPPADKELLLRWSTEFRRVHTEFPPLERIHCLALYRLARYEDGLAALDNWSKMEKWNDDEADCRKLIRVLYMHSLGRVEDARDTWRVSERERRRESGSDYVSEEISSLLKEIEPLLPILSPPNEPAAK